MKKLIILTALMLFVVATSAFAAGPPPSPQHQYDNSSAFILGSVTFGSAALAANSVGAFHLIAGEKATLDTKSSFTSIETPSTEIIKVSGSTEQTTSGFVDFTGTINP